MTIRAGHVHCPAPAGRAGRREWLGLAVLALPTLLLSLDLSVLYLALPRLGVDLQAGSVQLLWITDIYGFLITGFLITMGTLGDRIGHRRLLMIGAVGFSGASVLAAYSSSAEMLIAARALLGVAGATQMPATLALIRHMFRDRRQQAMAIAIWVSYWTAGTAIGPIVGGLLLERFWWGSVFLLAVPIMVVLFVLAPLVLPETRDLAAARIDLPSAVQSLAAILLTVYGLKSLAEHGLTVTSALAVIAGPALGVLFVIRQRRLSDPLVDLGLFRHRGFGAALSIMVAGLLAVGSSYLFVTQYLQLVKGLSPLLVALWLVPTALADIAAALMAAVIARRMRPGNVVAAGLAVAAAGYLLLAVTGPSSGLIIPIAGMGLVHIGIGPLVALGTDLVVGSAPPERAGSASSISETGTELGIALGIATLGTLGTAVYRHQIAEAPTAQTTAAGDGITEAITAAEQLPEPLATQLINSAYQAFTNGLTAIAVAGAVLSLILAVASATLLRHVPPTQPAPKSPRRTRKAAELDEVEAA